MVSSSRSSAKAVERRSPIKEEYNSLTSGIKYQPGEEVEVTSRVAFHVAMKIPNQETLLLLITTTINLLA